MKGLKSKISKLSKKAEETKKLANIIRIDSQKQIARLHAGNKMNIAPMRNNIKKLNKITKDPLIFTLTKSSVFIAFQEYAEAEIVKAITDEKQLPELAIPEPCYFTGLCDAIGEVKRQFMLELINKNYKKADYLLKRSLKIGSQVAEIDAPPLVIQSIKPKKDLVQRSIGHMLELSLKTKQ